MRYATLTLLTLLAVVAGAFFGQYVLFDPQNPIDKTHWTFVAGDLVLFRPLMLLAVPLAFAAVVNAARTMKATSRFGLALGATLAWFAVTMILSAVIGATAATTLKPGDLDADARAALIESADSHFSASPIIADGVEDIVASGQDTLPGAWLTLLRRGLPKELVTEISSGRALGLITLAILLGLGIAAVGGRGSAAGALFESLLAALKCIAGWISWIAPVGIFLLISNVVGSIGFNGVRGSMEKLLLTTLAALAAHSIVLLPGALLVLGRCNPLALLSRSVRALGVAFATSSSLATLPIAVETVTAPSARREPRKRSSMCSNAAAGFVLPLGAMLNLNGTAIFQTVAIVFLCQTYGIELSMNELVVIVITATIAAITATGLPSAGLLTLIIVITGVNTSLAGRGMQPLPVSAIGILIAVDRVLDMCRTVVNVWGNIVGARIITQIAPDDEGLAEASGGQ